MANKEILSLLKKNQNLCEISMEYPSLIKQSSIPRHLCTSIKSSKTSESISIDKLLNKTTNEHDDEKDSDKHSKNAKEEIELFQYKQEKEINNKLYKKCRYQLTRTNSNNDDDDEKRNNKN